MPRIVTKMFGCNNVVPPGVVNCNSKMDKKCGVHGSCAKTLLDTQAKSF